MDLDSFEILFAVYLGLGVPLAYVVVFLYGEWEEYREQKYQKTREHAQS